MTGPTDACSPSRCRSSGPRRRGARWGACDARGGRDGRGVRIAGPGKPMKHRRNRVLVGGAAVIAGAIAVCSAVGEMSGGIVCWSGARPPFRGHSPSVRRGAGCPAESCAGRGRGRDFGGNRRLFGGARDVRRNRVLVGGAAVIAGGIIIALAAAVANAFAMILQAAEDRRTPLGEGGRVALLIRLAHRP